MTRLQIGAQAPEFALADHAGQTVRLSDFRGTNAVLLVLNRGFS
jgi:peroxiredoxin